MAAPLHVLRRGAGGVVKRRSSLDAAQPALRLDPILRWAHEVIDGIRSEGR